MPLLSVLALVSCGPVTDDDFVVMEPEPSVVAPPPELEGLKVSREFRKMDDREIPPFAGLAVVAFPRNPGGTMRARAEIICKAFLRDVFTVEMVASNDTPRSAQVVTVWPVRSARKADQLEDLSDGVPTDAVAEKVCRQAVTSYDLNAGQKAIADAATFFESRGKRAVADRIDAPVQEGPWIVAWAPGDGKGKTTDNVLVLAFDLSHVDTETEAEHVFQAWRDAIEDNTGLWRQNRIANSSWSAAIIRFANALGRDLAFYKDLSN